MSKRWKIGAVIGKFLPPHRGHSFLIHTALDAVDNLTIIVGEREGEFLGGELRASWLRELFPRAQVIVIQDRYGDGNSDIWAQKTIEWLGGRPDVVFTSEDYGARWAHFMGCEHVLVDLERKQVPISATRVRENLCENWEWLEAPVRAYFAKRIVVLGAESSGTTTLALDLAKHYNTVWVPEYGRDYCEVKYSRDDKVWKSEEFLHIAEEQLRREDALTREANRVLICDTNGFATRLWHWRYCGFFEPQLDELIAAHHAPDLYLLTDVDIPFVTDNVRDGEHIRSAMHEKFIEQLEKQPVRWGMFSGSREERVEAATQLIDALLSQPRA